MLEFGCWDACMLGCRRGCLHAWMLGLDVDVDEDVDVWMLACLDVDVGIMLEG